MQRQLILRGLLAGAVAGLLAYAFARIFAEPQIQRAVTYESNRDAAQRALDVAAGRTPQAADPDVFSRAVQANVGLGVALILFGVAMGALFAVAYTVCLGRVGRVRARTLALLVAGAGFLTLYAVPSVKYPPNPPSIGNPDTIRARSGLYLVLVATSVVLLLLCVWLGRRLAPRFGTWNAALLAGATFVVAAGMVLLALPSLGALPANASLHQATETPPPLVDTHGTIVFPGFPADLLYNFRAASVGTQLLLWTAIGLLFGPAAERVLHRAGARPEPAGVTAG